MCVELWSEEPDAPHAIARAVRELQAMNVIDPHAIAASGAVAAPNVHVLTTLDGVQHLRAVRRRE